jgi:hypothetical protein
MESNWAGSESNRAGYESDWADMSQTGRIRGRDVSQNGGM